MNFYYIFIHYLTPVYNKNEANNPIIRTPIKKGKMTSSGVNAFLIFFHFLRIIILFFICVGVGLSFPLTAYINPNVNKNVNATANNKLNNPNVMLIPPINKCLTYLLY